MCEVDDVPEEIQEEFSKQTNDSTVKSEYPRLSLPDLWVKVLPVHLKISHEAFSVLISFSSTYLCESAFSSLLRRKTKAHNKLESETDLRMCFECYSASSASAGCKDVQVSQ